MGRNKTARVREWAAEEYIRD